MMRIGAGTFLGLIAAASLVGCNNGGDFKTAQQIKDERVAAGKPVHDEHDHEATGPHGGALVELGEEEYHGEVVIDGDQHTLTVYLLGPDAKTPAPISAEEVIVVTEAQVPLKLKAAPQEGDAEGKASKFELVDEVVVGPIVAEKFLHGALQLEAGGKPYRGEIDLHLEGSEHDDHDEHMNTDAPDPDHDESPDKKPAEDDAGENEEPTAPKAPSAPEE